MQDYFRKMINKPDHECDYKINMEQYIPSTLVATVFGSFKEI